MQHYTDNPTPRQLGFAMPPEWDEHAATWMGYPADDELWFGNLAGVRAEYADLVRTIARFERVELLLRDDESEQDARRRLGNDVANVRFHRVPLDDSWLRDSGPLFVTRPRGNNPQSKEHEVALVDWRFNAWGGKFNWQNDNRIPEYVAQFLNMSHWDRMEVLEGGALDIEQGVALTTRSCLLTDTRNPTLSEDDYALLLRDFLGVQHLLWLDGGLENDHTDGHIDTITRFAAPGVIVTSTEADPSDPNHATMSRNLALLRGMQGGQGQPLRVVELPLPAQRLEGAEGRLPPTYANFYIGNGFVVVPQYGDPNDEQALDILRGVFPGRQVIGLMSRQIIEGGGSFHCLTQQQPVGAVWGGSED